MTHILGYLDLNMEDLLSTVQVVQRKVRVYGKLYHQPRLTQWFGPVPYLYSGLEWPTLAMPASIEAIRQEVERMADMPLNSVLLNLYRDGQDCVGWHSDDEPLFGPHPAVVSLSLGATRTFDMRTKTSPRGRQSFQLTHGSVLLMPTGTQEGWQHCIPRTSKLVGPRLNLTFRNCPAV